MFNVVNEKRIMKTNCVKCLRSVDTRLFEMYITVRTRTRDEVECYTSGIVGIRVE